MRASAQCPRLDLQRARQRVGDARKAPGHTRIALKMRLVNKGLGADAAVFGKALLAQETQPFIYHK